MLYKGTHNFVIDICVFWDYNNANGTTSEFMYNKFQTAVQKAEKMLTTLMRLPYYISYLH
jgi:hypothetical protein